MASASAAVSVTELTMSISCGEASMLAGRSYERSTFSPYPFDPSAPGHAGSQLGRVRAP